MKKESKDPTYAVGAMLSKKQKASEPKIRGRSMHEYHEKAAGSKTKPAVGSIHILETAHGTRPHDPLSDN